MTDDLEERCGNCRWWFRRAPALATAARHMFAEDYIGACQLYSPQVHLQVGKAFSYFPETAEHRFCGEWEPVIGGDGPDGGEEVRDEAEPDPKVVPMRRTAA